MTDPALRMQVIAGIVGAVYDRPLCARSWAGHRPPVQDGIATKGTKSTCFCAFCAFCGSLPLRLACLSLLARSLSFAPAFFGFACLLDLDLVVHFLHAEYRLCDVFSEPLRFAAVDMAS